MAGQTTPDFTVKKGLCELMDCHKDTHVIWLGHVWVCGQCIDKAQAALNKVVLRDYVSLSSGED